MSSTTINPTSTSLPGITGATTPSTFTDTTSGAAQYSVGAVLTEPDTLVTAYQVPGTTGLLVVDGTTLTWRQQGITLSDGDIISAGFNGLLDQTTTALLSPIRVTSSPTSGSGIYTIETNNPRSSAIFPHGTKMTSTATTGAASTGTRGASPTSASSTSSTGTAPTLSAGKAVALLGALGGMVAFAL